MGEAEDYLREIMGVAEEEDWDRQRRRRRRRRQEEKVGVEEELEEGAMGLTKAVFLLSLLLFLSSSLVLLSDYRQSDTLALRRMVRRSTTPTPASPQVLSLPSPQSVPACLPTPHTLGAALGEVIIQVVPGGIQVYVHSPPPLQVCSLPDTLLESVSSLLGQEDGRLGEMVGGVGRRLASVGETLYARYGCSEPPCLTRVTASQTTGSQTQIHKATDSQ